MFGQFNPLELLTYYLIAINFVTFAAFGVDKARAEAGAYRLSEAFLLKLAAIGGTPGAWAGRRLFRHKTRKTSFNERLGVVTILQVVALGAIGFAIARSRSEVAPGDQSSDADPFSADYYQGCNEARDAGKIPLYRGDPGYREEMDGDGDGVACEPFY